MTKVSPFLNNQLRTKQDFQRLVNDLFKPLLPYYQKQGASFDLGGGGAVYDMKACSLEGVARPLWGIIPLVLGGGEFKHWDQFHRAIDEGTDPEHPNYWGETSDIDQRSVEMAVFGLLIALLPECGWEPLSLKAKNNFSKWLSSIQYHLMPQNNWLFFTVLVQAGLKNIGRADLVDLNVEETYLNRLKDFYIGDGWYGDGPDKYIDHYGGFAMHFYGLIYAKLLPNNDKVLSKIFLERAATFIEPFSYCFADGGECLIQGRSLTYRFATAGFWGMAAIAECSKERMGELKGLWARQIRYWSDKPIFDNEGILTRGFIYPSLVVCEPYNSPASPYWAMKAFFPLLLPDDHAFWTEQEKPLQLPQKIYPMSSAGMIIQRINGHSIAHYSAAVHPLFQLDKYNKFAYSTCFGFDVNSLLYSNLLSFGDNILAFSFDAGCNWVMRMSNKSTLINGNTLIIHWSTGNLDIKTEIEVLAEGKCIRKHTFELEQAAWISETGFAVSNWYKSKAIEHISNGTKARVDLNGENGLSSIVSLDEYEKQAEYCDRIHSNVSSPKTQVPFLITKLNIGIHTIESMFIVDPINSVIENQPQSLHQPSI